MSRFANLVLIAAAASLILFGVAAQTGTLTLARHQSVHTAHQSHVQTAPTPQSAQPPAGTGSGGGESDG